VPVRGKSVTRSGVEFHDLEFGKLTAAVPWLSCWFVGRRLVRENRPDWKSMEFEMPELAELQKDVNLLKMLFTQRGSTHRYLEEVFRIRNKWQQRIFCRFQELIQLFHNFSLSNGLLDLRRYFTGLENASLIQLDLFAWDEQRAKNDYW
jgi:hypothetical protein